MSLLAPLLPIYLVLLAAVTFIFSLVAAYRFHTGTWGFLKYVIGLLIVGVLSLGLYGILLMRMLRNMFPRFGRFITPILVLLIVAALAFDAAKYFVIYDETQQQERPAVTQIVSKGQLVEKPVPQTETAPVKETQSTAAAQTYSIDDVYAYYERFRYDYEQAITTIQYSYIAPYFKNGSTLAKDYEAFVLDHRNFGYYSYEFLVNDIMHYKTLDSTTMQITTHETFNTHSEADGSLYYDRVKRYIIKVDNHNQLYISDIIIDETNKQAI